MKKNVISRDGAIVELNKWFDVLQVPEDLRLDIEESEDEDIKEKEEDDIMRERVLRGIMSGCVILTKDNLLEYTLKDAVKKKESSEVVLDKLTFKLRYRSHELEDNMKGVKPSDFMPMTRAYIATLTGVSRSILGKLYNRDMDMAQAIYTLFTRGEA